MRFFVAATLVFKKGRDSSLCSSHSTQGILHRRTQRGFEGVRANPPWRSIRSSRFCPRYCMTVVQVELTVEDVLVAVTALSIIGKKCVLISNHFPRHAVLPMRRSYMDVTLN